MAAGRHARGGSAPAEVTSDLTGLSAAWNAEMARHWPKLRWSLPVEKLTWAERFAMHDMIGALMRNQRLQEMLTQAAIDRAAAKHCLGEGLEDATACGGGAIGYAHVDLHGACARCQIDGMVDLGLMDAQTAVEFDIHGGPEDWQKIERYAADKRDGR